MSCFNITSLQLSDTFNTWFQRTNQIISTINSIQIAGISVYDHPTNHYFGQKIEKINGSCYLTSEIITGPFINFQTGNTSYYGSGTSADPWKITLTFPNDSAFLADRQMTGNDELIINDSVSTGIPVKRIKAKDIVPSTIDVSYLRIQNRASQAQGSTFAFYTDSSSYNAWSGISASNFSAERLQGFVPSTTAPSEELGTYRQVIPVTDSGTGLIPDDFVRMPMIFRVGSQLVSGFDATADVKSFNISVSSRGSTAPGGEGGLLIQATTGTDQGSSVPNAVSYNIEALIPATGNSGPYGVNLFNINGYSVLHSAMSADSRSRLSAHMGLSGGKGISTNLVARGITVNYIIPGDPDNFIQYSGMTAVDIFTIAENPLDSNYVRKIGDIMTGTLTGTEASFDSLTATDAFIGTLTGTEASFDSLTATDAFIGTLTGTDASFDSFDAEFFEVDSLTATDAFIGTLTGTDASFDIVDGSTGLFTFLGVGSDSFDAQTLIDSDAETIVFGVTGGRNSYFDTNVTIGASGATGKGWLWVRGGLDQTVNSFTVEGNSLLKNIVEVGENNDHSELKIHGRALKITGPSQILDNEYVTKNYVDTFNTYDFCMTQGRGTVTQFSNAIGPMDYGRNYFDVLPPSGYTINNLITFIAVCSVVAFNGNVDNNDVFYNFWKKSNGTSSGSGTPQQPSSPDANPNRIRCWVGNTEIRSPTQYYWVAFWSKNVNSETDNEFSEEFIL